MVPNWAPTRLDIVAARRATKTCLKAIMIAAQTRLDLSWHVVREKENARDDVDLYTDDVARIGQRKENGSSNRKKRRRSGSRTKRKE